MVSNVCAKVILVTCAEVAVYAKVIYYKPLAGVHALSSFGFS